MFVYAPELLLIGSPWAILTSFLTAAFGIVSYGGFRNCVSCSRCSGLFAYQGEMVRGCYIPDSSVSYDKARPGDGWSRFCAVRLGLHLAVAEEKARYSANSRCIKKGPRGQVKECQGADKVFREQALEPFSPAELEENQNN